ncbi:MAG: radical SAM protein [Sphingomonadales bacterium 32-64-17]|nr:MAG: radical SAM protein [Sphingomonadales bacterium 32-64-17]
MTVLSKSRAAPQGPSPFTLADKVPLAPGKFADPRVTAKGETRAVVAPEAMRTIWLNTGTLCNLACANCYIESSPTNDALQYLTLAEAERFLAEIRDTTDPLLADLPEIGFTGGEPFMNPDIIAMLSAALEAGFAVLVLTNAMAPMQRHKAALEALRRAHGDRLTLRVSIDHHRQVVHEAERGPRSWEPMLAGLTWLSESGFSLAVAGRHLAGESEAEARRGYAALFAEHGVKVDAANPAALVLFPEMDAEADVPEITEACWGILGQSPSAMMCATSRMVVHRKGESEARVVACTLLPHDPQFDLGATLEAALRPVPLNHPHCARFCVLGGASCSQ